ncbi:hypothetical protein GCM10011506_38700 [Marivirga lumbricoides]|uniref:SusD/RagB family nutrient-binding outer membrane lipoprotein n=1 Tax=Marivirga lumbricoides TaxID=1046115 RepID=A0ABQ1MYS9_9BACT|nr:hypothetical protein GCM10011506_38700 [Marivirga lumbricoides]
MKYLSIIALSILLIGFSACEKFDEINTNPNTPSKVSSTILFTKVVLGMAKYSGDAKQFISQNALPKYVGYANEGIMGSQYNSLGNTDFNSFTLLTNIDKMVEYSEGSNLENSYRGLAKFARAYIFYQATMKVGDIPYTQAGIADAGLQKPAYDLQEKVFEGILNELKEADEYFATGKVFSGDPSTYNGDPEKWRRAVNSFALKVLMALSEKEGETTIQVKNRFAQIVQENNLLQSTADYFGLEYNSVNSYPLYSTNDMFTGRTLLSSLLVSNLNKLHDYRLFYFGEPASVEIKNNKEEDDSTAYVGLDVSLEFEKMNAGHKDGAYSIINLRYQNEIIGEPRMLITYAEQQLILAEASLKGWIGGAAKDYYEEGTRSALEPFKEINTDYAHGRVITQEYIDNYFTGEAAFKTNKDEQLQQVWLQRYLLHFMQDPYESYYQYRRVKYPHFPINPASSLNQNNKEAVPARWLYPTSETNFNRENLIEALERQYEGFDEINKVMWLLK